MAIHIIFPKPGGLASRRAWRQYGIRQWLSTLPDGVVIINTRSRQRWGWKMTTERYEPDPLFEIVRVE